MLKCNVYIPILCVGSHELHRVLSTCMLSGITVHSAFSFLKFGQCLTMQSHAMLTVLVF